MVSQFLSLAPVLALAGACCAEDLLEVVQFNKHIRPILAAHCLACHGGVKQASGLSFVYRERVFGEADSMMPIVTPGDVSESYLIDRVTDPDSDSRMPPGEHGPALSKHEIALLKRWIEQGAAWEEPWALVAPKQTTAPDWSEQDWCRSAIDHFILARLQVESLTPSGEAPRREWLRRVSFDLTGLPPTAEEIAAFERDETDFAYERVVDRLLASPRYGERWAAMWLDLARYADTKGYEKDTSRTAWPYRDWLIRAFNDDLPYDQFIIKQLAGDLLLEPTMDDLIATAFHRNTQTNTEGGTDDEEFRVSAVIDRVNTTWQVFGGTTFGCVQCHSHPYDPFEHAEYYRSLAFFNTTADGDLEQEHPKLWVPKHRADFARAHELDCEIAALEDLLHADAMAIAEELGQWRFLTPSRAECTGNAKLVVRTWEDDTPELIAGGTITVGSKFTLEFPLEGLTQLTAVRIDALPMDLERAIHYPEYGFVVGRLRAWLLPPDEEPQPIKFNFAFCDEAHPMMRPSDSLRDGNTGWSQFTRISQPSFAVFVPAQSVDVRSGSSLRLSLKHEREETATTAMVLRRSRYAVSGESAWTRLDTSTAPLRLQLNALLEERRKIKSVGLPIMRELPADKSRTTFAFDRGSWLTHGAEQTANVPAALPPLSAAAPISRLGLAQWFAAPDHPLTARVMVNRVWSQLFGLGLVETVGDLGSSGTLPSHPELLDYLALRFRGELEWSLKSLLRELVLSATYRQTAAASTESRAADSRNVLVSRGPRNRLTAEMVRDQALMVAGLLSEKMYGPPVMPPQPEGIWKSVWNGESWKEAEGENRYRRALYTYWKRTSAYPSMLMFDAPAREVCTARRIATNTPLQPLVTLNDPVFVECAQQLAGLMSSRGGTTLKSQLVYGYERATGVLPSSNDLTDLMELYANTAAELATQAHADRDAGPAILETIQQQALEAVATVLLNTDRALTK